MIARQYLITGIIWAIIGLALSVVFRIQLGMQQAEMSCPDSSVKKVVLSVEKNALSVLVIFQ